MRTRHSCLWLLLFALALFADGPTRLVRIPLWPDPGPALAVKDFVAKLDGRPASIVAAHGPADDLIVLLVVDLSEDLDLADQARQGLIAAINNMPERTHVALLRAQDGLQVLVDPTTDRAKLVEAVGGLTVGGKAGLLDTIETSARIADAMLEKAAVRVAVIYITDSDIRNYREDYTNPIINSSDEHDMSRRFRDRLIREKISKLERKLSGFDVPLVIVHLDYRSDSLNEAYQAGLAQLASTASRASTFCRSRAEIAGAVASAFHTVTSHYCLVLRLPDRHSKVVQVELENGGRTLTYRNRFVLDK